MWKIDFQVKKHKNQINSVSFNSDSSFVATASNDETIGLYNPSLEQFSLLTGHSGRVSDVQFCPTSPTILASSSMDNSCFLWNISTGEKIGSFSYHTRPVRCLCWSDDGKSIISGSHDRTAMIWTADDFSTMSILHGIDGWIRDVKWKNNLLAICGNDSKVLLFDSRISKQIQTLQSHSASSLTSLSFHRNGAILASGAFDQYIRVWDLRMGDLVRKQRAHSDIISDIAFSPVSEDLLSTSSDKTARIWNLKTNDIVTSFSQHDNAVLGCSWASSGKSFATVGADRKLCTYFSNGVENVPKEIRMDGGDLFASVKRMQEELENITKMMKTLDDRLYVQEEKIRMLKDLSYPISNAYHKAIH